MKELISLAFILASSLCFSQTNTLQIVGAAGNTASNGNTTLSWTIGEPIITTATNTNQILTQGFQQGVLVITALDNLQNVDITIHPNPTSDFAIIRLNKEALMNSQYKLTDLTGKIIREGKIESNQTYVSFQNLSNATYFIQVVTSNQQAKSFQIIKN
jgi:hypothetical protein